MNSKPDSPRTPQSVAAARDVPEAASTAGDGGELAPEDFYFDGPYMVFTGVYHLKRGYCCNSDCRHCPYR